MGIGKFFFRIFMNDIGMRKQWWKLDSSENCSMWWKLDKTLVQRSRNNNSLSGAAAIIGLKSGKILYLGVKNKYCCVCQRTENKGEVVSENTFYKNWNVSSTTMEVNIITEGFSTSLHMSSFTIIANECSSCYFWIIGSMHTALLRKLIVRIIEHLSYATKQTES